MATVYGTPNLGHQSALIQNKEKNEKHNVPSQEKKEKNTVATSPSQNPGKKESRNAKRRRWAKKNKPVAKQASVRSAPVFEYISACCSLPARKPRTGQKEMTKDPETGKVVNMAKGLGKFRCTGCGKRTKVTRRKPQSNAEVPNGTVEAVQPQASA